jgi:hypothetical protein
MHITSNSFRIFVVVFVILIGLGFSILTGFMYSESPVWISIAAMLGVLTSFILARKYLFWLDKITGRTSSRIIIWSLGTLVAIICGIICTTVVHGVMTAQLAIELKQMPLHLMDGFWLLTVMVSEAVGASAGLIAGGLCSLVYVLMVKDKSRETV